MSFELPSLPYSYEALEPHVSRRTMEFHHDKHHKKYIDTLNKLIADTRYADMALDQIMRSTNAVRTPEDRAIFNNAAQTWNHTFFWHSMSPDPGAPPSGLESKLKEAFGDFSGFRDKFIKTAVSQFGSGWAWLVLDGEKLSITSTGDAHNPLVRGQVPLLTCDVWEHAYYLDYQNRREAFVATFVDHLIDWRHVAMRLERAPQLEDVR